MASSDATAEGNAHPVRVGQRWKGVPRLGGGATTIEGTLAEHVEARPGSMAHWRLTGAFRNGKPDDDGSCFYDTWWESAEMTLLDAPPAVSPPDAPPWWYCEPCDVRVASSLVHACNPAAATKAPDRSGCKAWCGYDYNRIKENLGSAVYGDWMRTAAHPLGSLTFCSAACRDARYPPMEAKAPVPVAYTLPCGSRVVGNTVNEAARARAKHSQGCMTCPTQIDSSAPVAQQAKVPRPRCDNRGCETPYQNVAHRWCQSLDDFGQKSGAVLELSCEPCHLLDEADFLASSALETNILRDPSRPELLPRARLSHSYGVEDPTLEDA